MAVGITLRFQRDEAGRPRVLYLRDLLVACRVCGHEHIQRTYDETSYHHLTAARFRQLLAVAPAGAGLTCEQCGEPLGPDDVARWTLTYGFPGERGLIQGFGERAGQTSETRYSLSPHRMFDGQMLPEWSVELDQSVAAVDELTEALIHRHLGRYLSPKAGWRRVLKSSLGEHEPRVRVLELASGYLAAAGPREPDVAAALGAGIQAATLPASDWITLWLGDEINALLPEGPNAWLPVTWLEAIRDGRLFAVAAVDAGRARSLLEEQLATLPGPTELTTTDRGEARVAFPMGDEAPFVASLSLRELMCDAAALAVAPSDWVRLWLDDTIQAIAGAPEAADRPIDGP